MFKHGYKNFEGKTNLTSVGLMAILLIMAAFLAACNAESLTYQQTTPTSTPVEPTSTAEPTGRGSGETLKLLYWQAPSTLNPHLTSASQDWGASRITYEPLASFDKEGNLVPFLAAEIPSLDNGDLAGDGKSVTWKLKQDVKWSDGEPFTADDVLFTYQFISNPAVGASSAGVYRTVSSVEVVDDYTVRVNFSDVNPAWSLPFVGPTGMIIPRHIFEDYNGPNAAEAPANILPVGTGPYRVLPPGIKIQEVLFLGNELVDTNKIVFEPNPFFRETDKPFFSRVELRGGGTVKEAARLALQTGEVDFAWNLQVDAATLSELEAEGQGQAIPVPQSFVERIYFNFTDPNRIAPNGERASLDFPHPFFSDIKVRQAFAYAIDRETIAALYGSAFQPTSNILVSPAKYDSPNTSFEFNLEKAAALLDEAGWIDTNNNGVRDKDGKEMEVLFQTSANPLRQETQRIIQRALRSIGVDVEIKVIDSGSFFDSDPNNPNTAYHFYADLQMYNDGNPNPDPGSYMEYLTTDQIPQKHNNWTGENVGRWQNPEYDALYRQSTTEIDPDKRTRLFIQMNDKIIEDVAIIPLVHRARVIGVNPALSGVDPTPWDAELWNIKDWRLVSK
ncbi:MAG: peptide ABC transporter substrate-binding protein [Anaerolineae bacterium]